MGLPHEHAYDRAVILSLSLTHSSAGFEILERATAALGHLSTADLLRQAPVADEAAGVVVVSTCNRFEAYLDIPAAASQTWHDFWVAEIAERTGLDSDVAASAVATRAGSDAMHHLFELTCGLDSLVVGEEEIAGQVRRDYDLARRSGTTSPELDQAFQRALAVSRDVRARADLHDEAASVVHLALDLASGRIADWTSARVLLVGTGAHARTAMSALRGHGAERVSVFSATGRAPDFASRHGVLVAEDLDLALAQADVVVTCTSRTTIAAAQVLPRTRAPLLIVDLGLPRNVDPAVSTVAGVELLDLATIAKHSDLPQVRRSVKAHSLVSDAVEEYLAETAARPAVVALRDHVHGVLETEITRARRKAASPDEATRAEAALRHLAGVLMHEPTLRAREAATAGTLAAFEAGLEAVHGIDLPD